MNRESLIMASRAARNSRTRSTGRPGGAAGGLNETRVYERDSLAPGFAAAGPAVIEEYGSTTIVAPSDSFEVGAMREIRIHCGAR